MPAEPFPMDSLPSTLAQCPALLESAKCSGKVEPSQPFPLTFLLKSTPTESKRVTSLYHCKQSFVLSCLSPNGNKCT